MRDEYEITSSIQILIDDGYPVYPAEVIAWDMNITIVDDLILCNLKMLEFLNKDNEIGANVYLHPGAKIKHSVIGEDVVIKHPIKIQDSLILPGTIVESQKDIIKALIMNNFNYTYGENNLP
jgi:dTDP-glucose pyrophosphorylase